MSGDQKWINLSFVLGGLTLSWVLNQALVLAARYARIQNPQVLDVLPASAIVSLVVIFLFGFLYTRQAKVQNFCHSVVDEMKKVVWPEKKNAYVSTIVVLVTVVFMAVILGLFDWMSGTIIGLVLEI